MTEHMEVSESRRNRLDAVMAEIGGIRATYRACPNPNWVDLTFSLPEDEEGALHTGVRFFDLRKRYTAALARRGFTMVVDNQGATPIDMSLRDEYDENDFIVSHPDEYARYAEAIAILEREAPELALQMSTVRGVRTDGEREGYIMVTKEGETIVNHERLSTLTVEQIAYVAAFVAILRRDRYIERMGDRNHRVWLYAANCVVAADMAIGTNPGIGVKDERAAGRSAEDLYDILIADPDMAWLTRDPVEAIDEAFEAAESSLVA